EWTRYATGVLATANADNVPASLPAAWPPADVELIDVAGMREWGLRAAWRDGEGGRWAEAALPEAPADGFGVHPALLDAVLRAVYKAGAPSAWTGAQLYAEGATVLRAHMTRGENGWRIETFDEKGLPVLHAEALDLSPATGRTPLAPDDGKGIVPVAARPVRRTAAGGTAPAEPGAGGLRHELAGLPAGARQAPPDPPRPH